MRLLISSEISAGFSCMTLSFASLRALTASGRQRDFHLFETGLDRGVEHFVADHDADAADQLGSISTRALSLRPKRFSSAATTSASCAASIGKAL